MRRTIESTRYQLYTAASAGQSPLHVFRGIERDLELLFFTLRRYSSLRRRQS